MIKKKIVLITGGSGFLGEEMGSHLIRCGYYVINLGRKKPIFSNDISTSIHFAVDFYKSQSLEKKLNEVIKKYKKIDILVNNSFDFSKKTGFNSEIGRVENINKKTFMNGLESGIYWTFQCSQILAKHMIKNKKGVIINIASLYSFLVPDSKMYKKTKVFNPVIYSTSKHGVMGMTKYFASFWGPFGIRVNALSPGTFPNNQKNNNKAYPNKVEDSNFMKLLSGKCALDRVGIPSDLNSALEFLCSEKSSLLHGQNIVIDGGWSLL